MPRFRSAISVLAAFSVIATQLLCGCAEAAAAPMAAMAHEAPADSHVQPCHGERDSVAEPAASSEPHDCAHCATDTVMAAVADIEPILPASEPEAPDLAPAIESAGAHLAPRAIDHGSGPPSGAPPIPPETLVSLHILLLI